MVWNLGNALLLLEKLNAGTGLITRKVLDGTEKFRVFLANDLVKLGYPPRRW